MVLRSKRFPSIRQNIGEGKACSRGLIDGSEAATPRGAPARDTGILQGWVDLREEW